MPAAFQARFGQSANVYSSFRPEYPRQLFERIVAVLPADRRRRAVDLGAGTGKSTLPLLPYFDEVIAVEPDEQMAKEIRARESRVILHSTTGENETHPPASVDLVVIAAALHWMDALSVTAKAANWLRPRGILAVCGGRFPLTPPPIREVVRREFDRHWNPFRDPRLNLTDSSEFAVRAITGLALIEDSVVPNRIELAPEEFAGFCRSTSYGSAYARSITDPDIYWQELAARFRKAWPTGKLSVDFDLWLVLARKD